MENSTAGNGLQIRELIKDNSFNNAEQSELFHQDISVKEERYQGQWNVNFLAYYCRCLESNIFSAQTEVPKETIHK